MSNALVIVKVGGSLYALPDLGNRLRDGLERLKPKRALLVPGGGPTCDAIRVLDHTHRLGEEASHWLALQALSLNARFLAHLLPGTPVLPRLPGDADAGSRFILDPLPFFLDDEVEPGRFPHSWQVTSDSLTVRVAMRAAAAELILLKSTTLAASPTERWLTADDVAIAAQNGIVDGYFPEAMRQAPGLRARIVNLRQ